MPDDLDPELKTILDASGDPVRLCVSGEIDLFTAADFRRALDEATRAGGDVHVDLRGVGFIDSTGLRALLEVRREVDARGGRVALALTDDGPVLRLLDLSGVTDLFDRAEPPPEQG